jgi:hypothetical protein
MKGTSCGVNLNIAQPNARLFTRDYVNTKYDGMDRRIQRVVLHPHFQLSMQYGKKHKE